MHEGRGLCESCYRACSRDGTLLDYPRLTWRGDELVADAELLRARYGQPWREIAAELGVSFVALDRARVRARRTVA